MASRKSESETTTVTIQRMERGSITLYLLGTTPLMMNRMSKKTREQLLMPPRRVNRAARELTQKHDPVAEFRDAVYRCRDNDAPTLIHMPPEAFKGALLTAALDTPGVTKAQIGRLVAITDVSVFLFGKPYLHMGSVRSGNIQRTPDIRTRAFSLSGHARSLRALPGASFADKTS